MKYAFIILTALSLPLSASAVDEKIKNSPKFQQMFAGYAVCMACHQMDGKGVDATGNRLAPPLTGSGWLDDDDRVIRIILHGLSGPIKVGDVEMNSTMPAANYLTDKQIAQAISFARNSWGNKGKLVSPRRVAQVREAPEGRTRP